MFNMRLIIFLVRARASPFYWAPARYKISFQGLVKELTSIVTIKTKKLKWHP